MWYGRAYFTGTAISVNVVLLAVALRYWSQGDLANWLCWVVFLSQSAMLSIWLVIGRLPLPLRFFVWASSKVALQWWIIDESFYHPNPGVNFLIELLIISAADLGVILGMLFWSPGTRRVTRFSPDEMPLHVPEQFSVRYLLGLTVAVAFPFAAHQKLLPALTLIFGELPINEGLQGYLKSQITASLPVGVLPCWAALGTGRLRWRLPGALVAIVVLSVVVPTISFREIDISVEGFWLYFAGSLLFQMLTVLVTLLAFRKDGFRVVQKEALAKTNEPG